MSYYEQDNVADSEQRLKQPQKKTVNWLLIILGVLIVGGAALLIYKLVSKFRRDRCAKRTNNPEHQTPSSSTHGETSHQPHPVMHTFPPNQEPGKALATTKAEQVFGTEAMKHLEVLNMGSMAALIVETPDNTSIELSRDGESKIIQMTGMQPTPHQNNKVALMIMIYSNDCATCHAVAPKYVNGAVNAQLYYSKTPSAPLFKFAVVDYADMPIYMSKHVNKSPSFLIYDPIDKHVKRADIPDLNLLSSQIMGYYKNISDQM